MPVYEYACPKGHRAEAFRKIANRKRALSCPECQAPMQLQVSRPHVAPDGVYSYAPNVGSAEAFERKRAAIRDGVKVMPKA